MISTEFASQPTGSTPNSNCWLSSAGTVLGWQAYCELNIVGLMQGQIKNPPPLRLHSPYSFKASGSNVGCVVSGLEHHGASLRTG
jgi:hypothetical protein